jgi:hypothetical protein
MLQGPRMLGRMLWNDLRHGFQERERSKRGQTGRMKEQRNQGRKRQIDGSDRHCCHCFRCTFLLQRTKLTYWCDGIHHRAMAMLACLVRSNLTICASDNRQKHQRKAWGINQLASCSLAASHAVTRNHDLEAVNNSFIHTISDPTFPGVDVSVSLTRAFHLVGSNNFTRCFVWLWNVAF